LRDVAPHTVFPDFSLFTPGVRVLTYAATRQVHSWLLTCPPILEPLYQSVSLGRHPRMKYRLIMSVPQILIRHSGGVRRSPFFPALNSFRSPFFTFPFSIVVTLLPRATILSTTVDGLRGLLPSPLPRGFPVTFPLPQQVPVSLFHSTSRSTFLFFLCKPLHFVLSNSFFFRYCLTSHFPYFDPPLRATAGSLYML